MLNTNIHNFLECRECVYIHTVYYMLYFSEIDFREVKLSVTESLSEGQHAQVVAQA